MNSDRSLRRAMDRHESRPEQAQRVDEQQTAERVVPPTDEGYEEWSADPATSDYPGVDTRRPIEKMGYMAPITGHTLEPATSVWDVAKLAGFGGHGGHDAFEGISEMVTGEVDAVQEMRVDSATLGGPLDIAPEENFDAVVYPQYELGYEDPGDWTNYL